jgi:SH3 domain protein
MKPLATLFLCICLLLSLTAVSQAARVYVSDHFEITLRRGPGTGYKILRMLDSGTPMQSLEEREGWLKVRTSDGLEGWVIKKYTMRETPKRIVVRNLRQKVEDLRASVEESQETVATLRKSKSELQSALEKTRAELKKARQRYEQLKERSREALEQNAKYQSLAAKYNSTRSELQTVTAENQELRSQTTLRWFLSGAGVVLFSAFLGFLFGRRNKQARRIRY